MKYGRRFVYLVLATLALCCSTACSSRAAQRRLYRDVVSWLDANALAVETLAIPAGQRGHFEGRTLVEMPSHGDAFAMLSTLDAELPDYVLAVSCIGWDGVQAQPWFQARYRVVQSWSQAAVAASPITLYAYEPTPFDAARRVPVEGRFETPSIVLRGYAVSSPRLIPGEPLHLMLYWDDVPGYDFSDLVAVVRLVGLTHGDVWAEARDRLHPSGLAWTPDARLAGRYTLAPSEDLPEGEYALEVSLIQDTGRTIPVSASGTSADTEERLLLTTVSHPPDVARAPIAVDHEVDYRFGEAIRLLGYDAPGRAKPGDRIRFALLWHAVGDVVGDYTVFVHVVDDGGDPVAQDDAKPVYWFYPTTAWEPGDYVRDEHVLNLPPALPRGDYEVSVGLYDAKTGDRLTVQGPDTSGSSDHVLVSTLAVR
ncbi:MAG: hypothetical protein ACP5JG_15720 [Anaerolineae bacterium]